MYDLESGSQKGPYVTTTSVDTPKRPILGRRRTSEKVVEGEEKAMKYEQQEDGLTKVGNFLWELHRSSIILRYALYVLPVAAILAIPLCLTATVYRSATIDNTPLLGLFVWIEMIWVLLWVAKLISQFAPIIFQAICGVVSTGIRKYTTVLASLEIPLSLFIWTIAAFGSINVIPIFHPVSKDGKAVYFDPNKWPREWIHTLKRVFIAGIICAAIFLGEKTLVHLISIDYHRKQYDAKIKESKKVIWLLDLLYDASRQLFPEFCHEFQDEDEMIQGNNLAEVRKTMAKAGVGTKVLNNMGRARDKATAAFGAMVTDISGKTVFNSTSAHSIVVEALEEDEASKALARRLWLSFVAEGRENLYQDDLIEVLGSHRTEQAVEIFIALDRDGNGDVSLEEMTMLVVNVGRDRKNRATSMHEIGQAIAVLDRLLSLIVLIAIAFVYAAFFSEGFTNKITSLWTTFTGLAFAIGGTVTEFLSCCIFLFIKHPYDVGDRVNINDVDLVVEHISLMYSVFRRVDSDSTVQIPHNIANTLWIDNFSRSRAMKERLVLSVSASTSNDDILALRGELQKFVIADENRRDFQPAFGTYPDLLRRETMLTFTDIELINVGNMKQLDLQVEIRHKSNFSNELIRSTRRNKFMCELLAACRRIPIEPPGGSAPALGDPANPSYNVAVSDQEAINSRARKTADVEQARLFPTGQGPSFFEAISTGFQNPAQNMMAGFTGRRNGSVREEGMRQSSDSMRISQDSRPRAGHPGSMYPNPYTVQR